MFESAQGVFAPGGGYGEGTEKTVKGGGVKVRPRGVYKGVTGGSFIYVGECNCVMHGAKCNLLGWGCALSV